MTRACPVCGAALDHLSVRARTCSAKCRQALSRGLKEAQPELVLDDPASEPPPPSWPAHVTLRLRPYQEGDGTHRERFEALLDGEVICTHRSGWHEPARALLKRGWPPETLMTVLHEGQAPDPTVVPRSIGELGEWTVNEPDRGGLKKVRWQPMPEELRERRG